MPAFRRFILLLCACLTALLLPYGAHSQLRPVEVAPVQQLQRSVPAQEAPVPADAEAGKFYDKANPDLNKLQRAEDVRATLPLDKRGAIDWMGALRSGAIQPRADLAGTKRNETLNLDIILKNTKEMPYVKFPHNSHTEWLACSNCHDKLFIPKAGANPITMEKIFRGEYCGTCHDRVAFITHYSCERCHSVPHGDIKAWW